MLDVGRGQLGHDLAEQFAGVVDDLQQAGDVDSHGCAQVYGVVLQLREIEQSGGQAVAVLLPPAAGAVGGHVRERLDQVSVRALVVAAERTHALGAHPGAPGLYVADLVLLNAEQAAGLCGRQSGALPELAQLGA